MFNFIIKLFIKDHQNLSNPMVRAKYGNLASFFGIISNIFICAFKLIFGLIFNLISLIADGFNNLSDAGSSIISLIGFKLSSKPADKDHPFGHARIEYIAGFVVSILIVVLSVQLIINSINDIINNFNQVYQPMDEKEFIITIIVLAIAILLKLFQGLFYRKIGKKISSLTLIAASVDSRNDVIATSVVLLGLIISQLCSIYLDGYLGCLVGVFIFYSGIKLIKETVEPLISEKVDSELVNNIITKINSYEGILGTHDLQIHSYGASSIFASIHAEVDAHDDILKTHDLIDNIEKEIYQTYHVQLTIHMDPMVLNDPYTEEIKKEVIPLVKTLDYIENIHDFRVVKGPTHTNIIFDVLIKETKLNDKEIMRQIEELIKSLNPDFNSVITIDHNYLN